MPWIVFCRYGVLWPLRPFSTSKVLRDHCDRRCSYFWSSAQSRTEKNLHCFGWRDFSKGWSYWIFLFELTSFRHSLPAGTMRGLEDKRLFMMSNSTTLDTE